MDRQKDETFSDPGLEDTNRHRHFRIRSRGKRGVRV